MEELLTLWAEPYDETVDYLDMITHEALLPKMTPVKIQPEVKGIPGLSKRKTHELSQLLPRILKLVDDVDVEFVIDVGSGKSYLSRLLSSYCNVIAIERNQMRRKASTRLDQLTDAKVFYINDLAHLDTTEQFVLSRKKNNGTIPRALLVGLDVCGDLPIDLISCVIANDLHFIELVGCFVIPCCMHKITKLRTVDLEIPSWLGSQDLRYLTEIEIKEKFEQDDSYSLGWRRWCYQYGWMTQLFESIVLNDLHRFMLSNGVDANVDTVFDFNISSRNVMLQGLYPMYAKLVNVDQVLTSI